MGKSRKVHLRYELPKFCRDEAGLQKLRSFHGNVDSFFRRRKRFTVADLPLNLRNLDFFEYGYCSFDHLCTFRGCLWRGTYYTYDERSATEIKARIVATKLRKFNVDKFSSNYKKIFFSKNVLKNGSGFVSVKSLLDSIPELLSTGVNQYVVRRGADLLERFSKEKRTEVRKTTTIKESQSTKNSAKTIAGSQIIHCHYQLPKLFKSQRLFNKMARYYNTIDMYFRSWGKFTKEKFASTGFRKFTPKIWGYHSFDHLFIMRGCVPDGDYYTYDVRTATERKVRILAANLRKFSCAEFCDKFKKFFASEEILTNGCGFDSVESLLNSIPELMSTGKNQYEVRRGADLLEWISNEKITEVGKTTANKRSLSTKNSTKTIAGSQIINPLYELPQLMENKKKCRKMTRCYDAIDARFRSFGKFTKEQLVSTAFRGFKPKSWGYHSFDHLFIVRGCVPDGDYYTYDVRTATERKVRILAADMQKFRCTEFCDKFKKVFATEQILTRGCGFDSVKSLLNSIPELMSTGVDQYQVRRGADLLAWPKNGKGKEVGRMDDAIDRTISVRNSFQCEYEHYLPVVRSLKNPFTVIQFRNALARYYGITEEFLIRAQTNIGPQFLQRIPGVEKISKRKYRYFNCSTAGNLAIGEEKGVVEVEKLGQLQGIKRRSSAFKSPEESQGEPAPKRSKQVESSTGQDFPRSSIGSAGKKKKSKKTQSAHDGAKKKRLKEAKRKAKVKTSETTRSDSEIAKSALQSVKKKKAVSSKSGKRKKAARGESASTVRSQGNIEATGGMSEGESGEVVQKKLKKAEQKLKEVERKLKKAKTKLRRKKSPKSKRVLVKEEVTNYVESADGSPSNTSLLNDNVAPVVPKFSGFYPPPMPVFPSFDTGTAVNNSWSPSVVPPMNVQNATGTPTPKTESGSWTNSTEGAHQSMWTNGQMQPMMTLPGFTSAPVSAQMSGFGHFPPPPMAPCFPPSFDNTPTHVLGRVMSSIVTSALERSSEPRELTNQLFDAIFGRDRQQ